MRLLPTYLTLLALVVALALAGCSGDFAPTFPSPDGGAVVDEATSTVTGAMGGVEALPADLNASNFTVTLNGTETPVVRAVYGGAAERLALVFIIDSTGSMGGEIAGVVDSIQAFADSFVGKTITWAGIEYGDGTPADGRNTWDFFGTEDERTGFAPSTNLAAFRAWLETLSARGGGDAPENPLKALMEAKQTMAWPAGAARHFIILTDIGAHERTDGSTSSRPDGQPFSPYMGSEVLAAFRGWATVHCVSPDYSYYWSTPVGAAAAQNNPLAPAVWGGSGGWDVRELADGGPPEYRTHNGTGGKWTEMPSGGTVDLTTLGIKEAIDSSYAVTYRVPRGMASADVVITARYGGNTVVFNLGTVTF